MTINATGKIVLNGPYLPSKESVDILAIIYKNDNLSRLNRTRRSSLYIGLFLSVVLVSVSSSEMKHAQQHMSKGKLIEL